MLRADSFRGPKAFASWILRYGPPSPIQHTQVCVHRETALEIILFSEACWQIEMIFIFPDRYVPRHKHLRVSSCELLLGGGGAANVNGEPLIDDPCKLFRVPVGVWHGGASGRDGAVILSFQHWLSGTPSFISEDWHE